MRQGARAHLHPGSGRRVRRRRPQRHPAVHQGQRQPRPQGHPALGDGGRLQTVHQNGAGRRSAAHLRASSEHAVEARGLARRRRRVEVFRVGGRQVHQEGRRSRTPSTTRSVRKSVGTGGGIDCRRIVCRFSQ